jgi:hypothetical protein
MMKVEMRQKRKLKTNILIWNSPGPMLYTPSPAAGFQKHLSPAEDALCLLIVHSLFVVAPVFFLWGILCSHAQTLGREQGRPSYLNYSFVRIK